MSCCYDCIRSDSKSKKINIVRGAIMFRVTQSRLSWGIALIMLATQLTTTRLCADIRFGLHGDMVGKTNKPIKEEAIVEHVMIYSQENKDSNKKINRKAILVRHKQAEATVLICHGFMCDKHDVSMLRSLFKRKKYNLMTFDFRAHGEDIDGQYCTFGRDEAFDVIAAAKFIKNHPQLKDKPVYVYGFSMGAVAAIEAQAKDPSLFKAMILDCPFDSSKNLIKKGLDNLKVSLFGYEFEIPGRRFLQKYAFHPYIQSLVKTVLKTVAKMDDYNIRTHIFPLNPVESVKKITVPCFFIHCKNDQKVTIQAVESVYNGAAGYKRLWLTNGRRHYDSFFYNPEKYTKQVRNFLDQVLSGELFMHSREMIFEDEEEEFWLTG